MDFDSVRLFAINLMSYFQLFDHIVTCISEFLTEHGMNRQQLTLGFTFSFPCCQKGIASAKLVQWTKGFKCSDVESHDVVQLLQEAIDRRGVSFF